MIKNKIFFLTKNNIVGYANTLVSIMDTTRQHKHIEDLHPLESKSTGPGGYPHNTPPTRKRTQSFSKVNYMPECTTGLKKV